MPTPLSQNDIDTLGARAETMVNSLGTVSAEPDRLVRLFLTPEHRRAADRVADWMRDAGLSVAEDALGTVRGRLEGTTGKRLLVGSHIDTVINAGMYDGPFGVIAGILAAEHFARRGAPLPCGVDVLAFGDEEGSRFPATRPIGGSGRRRTQRRSGAAGRAMRRFRLQRLPGVHAARPAAPRLFPQRRRARPRGQLSGDGADRPGLPRTQHPGSHGPTVGSISSAAVASGIRAWRGHRPEMWPASE